VVPVQIEQDYVGMESAETPQRIAPVTCLADDLKILVLLNERAHAFT
jgi:hypothetical protein